MRFLGAQLSSPQAGASLEASEVGKQRISDNIISILKGRFVGSLFDDG